MVLSSYFVLQKKLFSHCQNKKSPIGINKGFIINFTLYNYTKITVDMSLINQELQEKLLLLLFFVSNKSCNDLFDYCCCLLYKDGQTHFMICINIILYERSKNNISFDYPFSLISKSDCRLKMSVQSSEDPVHTKVIIQS